MIEGYTIEMLQNKINYKFKTQNYLKQALTHSSYANERVLLKGTDYERLEFLGDAVLEMVSSEFIFMNNPNMLEGDMTKLRASLVCEQSLAFCAKKIGIGNYIMLGRGEEHTGGRNRDSIISDVLEALIGAIFLDGGYDQAKKFILGFVLSDIEHKTLFSDSKTSLQEIVQKDNMGTLRYELTGENGPEHNKEFIVRAFLDEIEIGQGIGRNKKTAEQNAAYDALLKMKTK